MPESTQSAGKPDFKQKRRTALDHLARQLLEHETVDGDAVRAALSEAVAEFVARAKQPARFMKRFTQCKLSTHLYDARGAGL